MKLLGVLDRAGELIEEGLEGLEQRTSGPSGGIVLGIVMGLMTTLGGIAVFLLVLAFLVEVFA